MLWKVVAGMVRSGRFTWGKYRIVYAVEDEVLTVVIIRIGHRRESYGRL